MRGKLKFCKNVSNLNILGARMVTCSTSLTEDLQFNKAPSYKFSPRGVLAPGIVAHFWLDVYWDIYMRLWLFLKKNESEIFQLRLTCSKMK
jgi:hypothetical protein